MTVFSRYLLLQVKLNISLRTDYLEAIVLEDFRGCIYDITISISIFLLYSFILQRLFSNCT